MRSGFPPRKGTNETFMFIPEIMENCTFLVIVWSFESPIPGFWLEITRPPWEEGARVSHRGLRAHSALSPSACLFWLGDCNPTRGASIHGLYVSPSLCSRPVVLKEKGGKHGGDLQVVFLPSPFKSTLRRAPLWPLMLPVHLAKRSGET